VVADGKQTQQKSQAEEISFTGAQINVSQSVPYWTDAIFHPSGDPRSSFVCHLIGTP
jgi:hypothetical protein